MAPYRADHRERVVADGPAAMLLPATAQAVALALHELATNAVKYGALSSISGRLKVSWELKPSTLVLHWQESGGPRARKPAQLGFGTRIIVASVEGQLGGQAKFQWGDGGLHCILTIPRGEKIGQPALAMREKALDDKAAAAAVANDRFAITGNRVMVVEDEALVAMVVSDAMIELGYQVVGPFSRPPDAIAALKDGGIAAAILDINLAGTLVYPVAEELTRRGIPFVFVTGYGIESIDQRFADIPVLQKPIERETLQRIFANGREGSAPSLPHGAGATNGAVQAATV
jgi:CheY-like chemotaxis protein